MGEDHRDSSYLEDLSTPTIKSDMYTTGRGGSGNMAKNDPENPRIARESQDVEGVPMRDSTGDVHFGRGGAANVIKPPEDEAALAREENERVARALANQHDAPIVEEEGRTEDVRGWADKGKDFLLGRRRRGK
ncbi:MAG: hypothetical protein M1819_004397 [Sarea resinae]|nr:MAG: hypothetical protein M1819_004397 [Sarea resinae]